MSEKRYFITGAAGFVGANLLHKLISNSQEVHILVKKESDLWRITQLRSSPFLHLHFGDLLNQDNLQLLIKKISPTHIYHLAAHGAYPSDNDPDSIFSANLFGTLHLIKALENIPYKLFVQTGSSSEYGFQNEVMSEDHTVLSPMSYYAISKASATHLCSFVGKSTQKPIISVRLFSVYGPYEEPSRFVPTLIRHAITGKPLKLTQNTTVRDFIYVGDVIDFLLQPQLETYTGEIFNLGTGLETTLLQVVKILEKICNHSLEILADPYPARTWDTLHWKADITKTKRLLKWETPTSLEIGLQKTLDWSKTHT